MGLVTHSPKKFSKLCTIGDHADFLRRDEVLGYFFYKRGISWATAINIFSS